MNFYVIVLYSVPTGCTLNIHASTEIYAVVLILIMINFRTLKCSVSLIFVVHTQFFWFCLSFLLVIWLKGMSGLGFVPESPLITYLSLSESLFLVPLFRSDFQNTLI